MEEIFHYTITVGRNQFSNRNHQPLLYLRIEGGVGKNRVIKGIHVRFMFLERQQKLLLAAPTATAAANISGAKVYDELSFDN